MSDNNNDDDKKQKKYHNSRLDEVMIELAEKQKEMDRQDIVVEAAYGEWLRQTRIHSKLRKEFDQLFEERIKLEEQE